MITPTTITTEDQIYLVGSPVNLRIRNANADTTIQRVVCELYIWSGALNTPPTLASYTLVADKVSKNDNYINFEISEIIASHINGTKFAWASGDNAPSIAGEGVFFHTKHQCTSTAGTETPVESYTKFATKGFRYDFEQVGDVAMSTAFQPYLGLIPINYSRNYTDKIKYFKRSFDFTKSLIECTSENIIKSEVNVPTVTKCQLGDKYLIVYINRLGLWDYFTTYGKAIKSVKPIGDANPRLYRNPNSINNNTIHSKQRRIETSDQPYVINSGDLHETMTDQVEEVIYSPLIYLIEFTGETFVVTNVGLTVDSTTVTVDSTLYTVDNETVTSQDIGYFSKFKQVPVVCTNEIFIKKTRLNDKSKINYDFQFEATQGRINQLK